MATVFTTSGKGWQTGKDTGGVVTSMNQVAWGTGAGTAAVGDAILFTEASEARVTGTLTQFTTTVTNDTFRIQGTITANGSKTITNAGVLDAAAAGVLGPKGDFSGIPLNVNDSIAFDFRNQFT